MNKNLIFNVHLILVLLLTVLVFYPGITFSFSSDDYIHLLNNTKFKNISEVWTVFTEPFGREYRPLVRISLWINHLMGDTAIPFKITNLLLHLLTTFFVYIILNKLQFSNLASIAGTAIFALHPIHVTSIHFILGRTDLVAAVFYFGTLALVAQWKSSITIKEYILVGVVFTAALLSKEMSITLCFAMFALVFQNQQIKNTKSFIRILIKLSPFFAATLIYIAIRIFMWSKLIDDVAVYTNYSVPHLITNYLTWVFGLIYPLDLYFAQDLLMEKPLRFFSAIAIFSLLILVVTLRFFRQKSMTIHKSGWLWVGLAWIFITLLPICGGNPHRWYLYIPSFGLCIVIAAAIEAANKKQQKIASILLVLILFVYSIEDIRLSKVWARQSELNTSFLEQIATNQIYKKEYIYFANIPFGFKSAYLFTHNSLQEAMQYYFGRSPKVMAISYVNMSDETEIQSSTGDKRINFKIVPDHYNFFMLSANERRFDRLGAQDKYNIKIDINAIAKNKKISDYSVIITDRMRPDFYYFDGKEIKSLDDVGH